VTKKPAPQRRSTFQHVWSIPLILAALTMLGLLTALLGAEAWRPVAWIAIAAPVVIALRYALLPRASTSQRDV
jgi:hypothetical protein